MFVHSIPIIVIFPLYIRGGGYGSYLGTQIKIQNTGYDYHYKQTNKQTNADVKSGGTSKIRGRLDWMWVNKSGVY